MRPFLIPDDFRAFMQQVVQYLDAPGDEPKFVDAEDALQNETGYGGRIDDVDLYRFTYITRDGQHKWQVQVREPAIRDIADGLLIEVMGERFDLVRTNRRDPKGNPLLIWGEYGDDALIVRDHAELLRALDSLHQLAKTAPRMVRIWSAAEDQVVAVMSRDDCAIYVVESMDGYSTSCGDASRKDGFDLADHDGRPFTVPYADCLQWSLARNALLRFIDRGDLGPEIRTEGCIPSGLLMMGDVDRESALAVRSEAPRTLARSSIPRMLEPAQHDTFDEDVNSIAGAALDEDDGVATPHDEAGMGTLSMPPIRVPAEALPVEELVAWARRLLDVLDERALIELGPGNRDEISYHLGGLLQAHGLEAQHSLETAEWLANEIGAVRGISRLFATGGDLQIALRRSRTV